MRLPELKQMRCFREVARTGHFGRAARTLAMSHSALTEQVQRLEDTVGQKLLERDRRGVRPTAAGAVFLVEAKAVLSRMENAISAIQSRSGTLDARLRIGFSAAAFGIAVPAALNELRGRMPSLALEMIECSGIDAERALFDDEIDCLFIAFPPNIENTQARKVGEAPLFASLRHDHRLAQKEVIELADLNGEEIIFVGDYPHRRYHDAFFTACEQAGSWPRVTAHTQELVSVFTLVASGFGIGITQAITLPEEFGIVFRTLGRPQLTIPTHFVRRSDRDNPILDMLANVLDQVRGN